MSAVHCSCRSRTSCIPQAPHNNLWFGSQPTNSLCRFVLRRSFLHPHAFWLCSASYANNRKCMNSSVYPFPPSHVHYSAGLSAAVRQDICCAEECAGGIDFVRWLEWWFWWWKLHVHDGNDSRWHSVIVTLLWQHNWLCSGTHPFSCT